MILVDARLVRGMDVIGTPLMIVICLVRYVMVAVK